MEPENNQQNNREEEINEADLSRRNEVEAEFVPEDSEGAMETAEQKLKKLRDELKECQTEKLEYLAMSQRLKADYLNLKREGEATKEEVVKFATEPLLRQILELADSFELAFANQTAWQAVDANWRTGVEYIYVKLQNILEQSGLVEIPAKGEIFNPLQHHAIELVEPPDLTGANRIVEVVQKGYTLHGKTIRPAQVKVGK